jgi:hypothetical protein
MRHLCSPCSRAMVRTRPTPWTKSQPPRTEDWRARCLAWMDRGELPSDRFEGRRIVRMAKSFTLVTASCTSAMRQASCSGAYPSPRGASSSGTSTRVCVATTRRHAPSWATRFARASTGLPQLPTPARSCAPAKGANSTPAKPTSQRMPFRRSPSRGLLLCGAGHCRAPAEGARGLHPPAGCH